MDLAAPLREKYEKQIDQIVAILHGRTVSRESATFKTALEWIKNFPVEVDEQRRATLVDTVCRSFELSEADLYGWLGGAELPKIIRATEEEFASLVPTSGWFYEYSEYTRRTEAPMSFHIFSSLCVLGAAIGRKAWLDMGSLFRIYPNYRVILIGPTGKVHKTAAVSVARRLIHANALVPIFADKITPEAIVTAMKENGGTQLIYAPEASVFLGRQRYNEGLITLMLRLLDDPDTFEAKTEVRGNEIIENIAISVLAGSTLSLLAGSSAGEVTSGGFLNRFVLVVEEDTARCFPIPALANGRLEEIERTIKRVQNTNGTFLLAPAAHDWWETWYMQFKRKIREYDESTAEVMQRFPDHMLRTAMLSHIADCGDMRICVSCLERADRFMSYVELRVPKTVQAIEQTQSSADAEFVAATLHRMGDAAAHSKLLQRCSYRMNAQLFRAHINTLAESKRLRIEKRGALHFYILSAMETSK